MITIEAIKSHLLTEILKDDSISLSNDQDLLLSGLLDSLNVVRLASFLETSCKLSIPPEDVVLENFGSLNSIEQYLKLRGVA